VADSSRYVNTTELWTAIPIAKQYTLLLIK